MELPRADGSSLVLTLQPLPLGFHGRLRDNGIVPPTPPVRVARDSTGKPIRDGNGLALMRADEQDPRYRQELELYHQRVAVLVLVESLQADPDVEIETPAPAAPSSYENMVVLILPEFSAVILEILPCAS